MTRFMLEVYADVFEGLQYAAPMRFRHMLQWRYRPGTLNGQPVTVIFNITILFGPKKPAGVN
jgi:hypothetical protein